MSEDAWQSAQKEITRFRKRMTDLPDDVRTTEALIEIAVQLMWLNTQLEKVELAINSVADRE